MVSQSPGQTLGIHAPGARMTVVQTNSLKSLLEFFEGSSREFDNIVLVGRGLENNLESQGFILPEFGPTRNHLDPSRFILMVF